MSLFPKIEILIIVFCFFQYINLTNYISFKLIEVDDCVRYINVSNQIVFNFSRENVICDTTFQTKGACDAIAIGKSMPQMIFS